MCSSDLNPKDAPSIDNLPGIQFFELGDVVVSKARRGATQKPIYKRRLTVVAELFLLATNESSANNELEVMIENVKKKIFADGNTLGGLCEIDETEASRVLRPPVGGPVIGIGIGFEIAYIEDMSKLFI